jgi:hypothetical protein
MMLIAHRGNTKGPEPDLENQPTYVIAALDAGFQAETDVWEFENSFWLGHDRPVFKVHRRWVTRAGLWCHAKSPVALHMLMELGAHCFAHEQDVCSLTSRGYIWTFPEKPLVGRSIAVVPEVSPRAQSMVESCCKQRFSFAGICSDFIEKWKREIV